MNKLQTFQEFLATQSGQIPVLGFVINMFLAAILAFVLRRLYISCGSSLSNRKVFANNFVLIAMTTTLIITVVKSSLALSLGLVGALSIVRFRAAIKEPEELAYLFLAVAIGLGFGADQKLITIAAFIIMCGIVAAVRHRRTADDTQNLYLTVTTNDPAKLPLEKIVSTLKDNCSGVNMKRFDEAGNVLDASFFVEFDSFGRLEAAKKALRSISKDVKITFMDNRGAF